MEIISNNDEEAHLQFEQEEIQPEQRSQGLSFRKTGQKKHLYYSLKVSKIEEIPLLINPYLEIKFKYLVDTFAKIFKKSGDVHVSLTFNNIDLPQTLDYIVNECTMNMNSKKHQIQQCLEESNHEKRIDLVQKLLQESLHITSYMIDIEKEAKNKIRNKKLFEYYSEMMKITKEYLDGKKTKQLFIEKCMKSFNENNPPKEIREVFEQELDKYHHMDENSMEAGVVKAYLEELSKIPYNVKSDEVFDLEYAEKILDEDHYGMKEVKEAILEVIAVGKLKKTLKGKIFCFIGGPGLGKTSFAKSVAKALNRKFYNISLGGVSDSSALKGHRRTYIGAYSGKIIEALKNCGTNNPVILLDEIDKMGSSYQGDPRSQLLQILDPNQNSSFVDNFLDVPVDLSNVLFITSANYEQNISKPLLDRMEKIKLTSYTKSEKIQIFTRHLLRRAILASGVSQDKFELSEQTINSLVEEYSRGEPGVRYLEKAALNILEKIAYKIVTEQEELPIKVTKENLNKYLGNSYFRLKDHHKINKGVAISLGGGSYGSRLTYIEAFKKSYVSRKQVNRGILFTGSLGDVFKEAMNISYTYARNFLLENLSNRFLYENEVHLHAPQGASKKDGSTDSLTIASALVSLAIQKKVKLGVALTGELTLNGHILRTHGIKQKVIVAKREKIAEVILPAENFADVDELSEELKDGIKFHYVSQFSEVFEILFPEIKLAQRKESSSEVI